MLSPIGVRGSSDAYGSWKMICIRRRYGCSAAPFSVVMSVPSKTIVPAVGSMSRSSSRPTVVLPQPDSPTRPSVSPRRTDEVDAVDGAHLGDGPLQDAAADRGTTLTGRGSRPAAVASISAGVGGGRSAPTLAFTSCRLGQRRLPAAASARRSGTASSAPVARRRPRAARDGRSAAEVTLYVLDARRAARREAAARRAG